MPPIGLALAASLVAPGRTAEVDRNRDLEISRTDRRRDV